MSRKEAGPPPEVQMPPTQSDAGLPTGHIQRIVHNAVTKTTIAQIRIVDVPPLNRLFWRRAASVHYSPVCDLPEFHSLEDAITGRAPWLFAREVVWSEQGRGFGATTIDVVRVDLGDKPKLHYLRINSTLPSDGSVVKLLRVDDAGLEIDAVVVWSRDLDRPHAKRARYVVCRIDLSTGNRTELDVLPGIRF